MRRVLPILVVYKCQMKDSAAYQSVIHENGFREWVVYDNSPADYVQQAALPPCVHYYHDVENGGLSKAYNYGAKVAEQLGYEWILLLDQDTSFPSDAVAAYFRAIDEGPKRLLAPQVVLDSGAAFSPARTTLFKTCPVRLAEGTYSLHDYSVINSGCCIPLSLYQAAGGYNEKVRLDFSDYQFQRRLKAVEPRFSLLPVVLVQDFSNNEQDVQRLMTRYLLYLHSARYCEHDGWKDRLAFQIQLFKHTLALSLRTHSLKFLANYIKKYLFKL